jgi:hypothetical protein
MRWQWNRRARNGWLGQGQLRQEATAETYNVKLCENGATTHDVKNFGYGEDNFVSEIPDYFQITLIILYFLSFSFVHLHWKPCP